MSDTKVLDFEKRINKFNKLFQAGLDSIKKACIIYAKDVDSHGQGARKAYSKALPQIPSGIFARFYAVGSGGLAPELLYGLSEGEKRLANLSICDQKIYLRDKVEVLTANGDHLRVAVKDLSPDQAIRVISEKYVRSLDQQKNYLEQENRRYEEQEVAYKNKISKPKQKICRIRDNGLIYINGSFSRQEIMKLTRELYK